MITDAEVKPYVPGVSLIWHGEGAGGGVVKLADLPENLRARFGYDPAKAAAADAREQEKRTRDVNARAAQTTSFVQPSALQSLQPSLYTPTYSSGGRVWVNGYTRRDGTYVNSYTRRR